VFWTSWRGCVWIISRNKKSYIQHLESLKNSFKACFPLPNANNKLIRSPLNTDVKSVKNLITCEENNLVVIWYKLLSACEQKYPELAPKPVKYLMPSPTIYFMQEGFLSAVSYEIKIQELYNVEPNVCLKLSTTETEIQATVLTKQHK
jgi:hypothetical protein